MKRIKVIRVYKSLKAGGGVHVRLRELLPRLSEHAEVRVLCYRERGEAAGEFERAGIGVDVIRTGPKWAPGNVSRYVAYFRAQAPDVVHTHEYTANTLGIAAAARADVPVRVRHLHSLAPWGWAGRVRTWLRVREDRRAAVRAQLTLSVSEAVRQEYLCKTRLPPESCRVLYNGIDLTRFECCRGERGAVRSAWGIDSETPLVGIVGRLSRGKGHREFLGAARRIRSELPRARFVVVGEGGERKALETLAGELGLGAAVLFTGHRDDVPAVLGALDLFLFPSGSASGSRIQDGLPGVVIEAQAAGLPVVAFRLPMMEEIVKDGCSGVLVAPGDEEGLAAAAVEYLLDGARSEAASREARRAASAFSLTGCIEKTLGLYEELLRGASR